jgi:hypothetical protein
VAILLAGDVLIVAFAALRRALGIELASRVDPRFGERLGVWGPLVFIAIVALRIPLAGALGDRVDRRRGMFGLGRGTLYGAVGPLDLAIAAFSARAGPGAPRRGPDPRAHALTLFDLAARAMGALVVALGTAYRSA